MHPINRALLMCVKDHSDNSMYSRKCSHKQKIIGVLKYHHIFNKTAFGYLEKKKKLLFHVLFSWTWLQETSQYPIWNPLLFEKGLISTLWVNKYSPLEVSSSQASPNIPISREAWCLRPPLVGKARQVSPLHFNIMWQGLMLGCRSQAEGI